MKHLILIIICAVTIISCSCEDQIDPNAPFYGEWDVNWEAIKFNTVDSTSTTEFSVYRKYIYEHPNSKVKISTAMAGTQTITFVDSIYYSVSETPNRFIYEEELYWKDGDYLPTSSFQLFDIDIISENLIIYILRSSTPEEDIELLDIFTLTR